MLRSVLFRAIGLWLVLLSCSVPARVCAAGVAAPEAPVAVATAPPAAEAGSRCISDCTPRIGIISAFGAEADLLLAALQQRHDWQIAGNRYSTGVLQGQPVVVVLSGVSLVNAAMTAQQLIDHFHLQRLLLSGIAGGIDPAGHVGDVRAPERWALPLETWWGPDGRLPDPCGAPGDLSCLGLQLFAPSGVAAADFRLAQGSVSTGLRMRESFVRTPATGLTGEFRMFFPVDAEMLSVAASLAPGLTRCGPRAPERCVSTTPTLQVGGTGVSVPAFLANGAYRSYLSAQLQASVLDMETAAVAQVAYANGLPFLAFRSVSDLAGGAPDGDVGTLFRSGLAETNASRVTLGWLAAWGQRHPSPVVWPSAPTQPDAPAASAALPASPRPLKVLIISMFAPEAAPWLQALHLDQSVPVAGLAAEYPVLRCNADDVCLLTTGMGHTNAAASTMAVAFAPQLDLRQTWFLVAGIAGVDPQQATLGSAAWAHYLVDFGLAQELDARDMPASWPTGYLPVNTAGPGSTPKFEYHTEVYQLDARLVDKAFALSRGVLLADSAQARAYRRQYREVAARSAPQVLTCDTLAGDTWWHGHHLGQHARAWVRLLTAGKARYCTTQQEDNATAEALTRATAAGRLDVRRLAVLRTGANFDRPHPGQSALASLHAESGGFLSATENLVRAGRPLVDDIVRRWPLWSQGVPAD